ncbi:hypothetical protein DW651_07700 [Subdoligranulum sp. AM23-21AC]|nr:hypothetical protein DW651_07700 [Subdoligranulum sp. AM23-21AC]RJW31589.1 hypothetical protein DXC43_08005 [Subdoligranulum sp. TF05-17AC]
MRPGRENDSRRGRVLFFLYALYFTMRGGGRTRQNVARRCEKERKKQRVRRACGNTAENPPKSPRTF